MKTRRTKIVILLVVAMLASLIFVPPVQAAEGDVEINETNFPCDVFMEFVMQYDENEDMILQVNELEAVTDMDLFIYVTDTTGIHHFTNLVNLRCEDCDDLVSLNLSGCTSLENLYLVSCASLESLNLSGCTNLKSFYFDGPENYLLKTIDVSSCINLRDLRVYALGDLQTLNITGCINLENLFVLMVPIKSIDLSDKTKLKKLGLGFVRPETPIDISACKNLIQLGLFACNIKELDLSEHKDLQILDLSSNSLTSLDVSGCADLWQLIAGEQWGVEVPAVLRGEHYEANLGVLYGVDIDNIKSVTLDDGSPLPAGISYDSATGILTMDSDPEYTAFKYVYDTNANLDKLDIPPAGYIEVEDEEEDGEDDGWRVVESSPDLEVSFTINIVEESPVPPVVTQEVAEENDIEVDEESGVITYQQEQSKDIPLKIGAEDETVDDFLYVMLGTQQLSRKHYDVRTGSIIVTLKQAFLSSLPEGVYQIRLFTRKLVSNQTINVLGAPTAPPSDPDPETDKEIEADTSGKIPATGEHMPVSLWFYATLLLALGSALLLKSRSSRYGERR